MVARPLSLHDAGVATAQWHVDYLLHPLAAQGLPHPPSTEWGSAPRAQACRAPAGPVALPKPAPWHNTQEPARQKAHRQQSAAPAAMAEPATKAALAGSGMGVAPGTGQQLRDTVARKIRAHAEWVKAAGMVPQRAPAAERGGLVRSGSMMVDARPQAHLR